MKLIKKVMQRLPWRWQSFMFGTEFSFHPRLEDEVNGTVNPLPGGVFFRSDVDQPPILEPGQRYTLRDLLPIRWEPELEGCIAEADLKVGKGRVVTGKPPETWAGHTEAELLQVADRLSRCGHGLASSDKP